MATTYFKRLHKAKSYWTANQAKSDVQIALDLLNQYAESGAKRFIHGHWATHNAAAVNRAITQFNRKPQIHQNTGALLSELGKALKQDKVNPVGSLSTIVQVIMVRSKPNYFARKAVKDNFGLALTGDQAYKAFKRYSANAFLRFLRGERKNDRVKLVRRALKAYKKQNGTTVTALLAAINAEMTKNNVNLTANSPLKALLDEAHELKNNNFKQRRPQQNPSPQQQQNNHQQQQQQQQTATHGPQVQTQPQPVQQPRQFDPTAYPSISTQTSINGKQYTQLPNGAYDNITTDHGWQIARVDYFVVVADWGFAADVVV